MSHGPERERDIAAYRHFVGRIPKGKLLATTCPEGHRHCILYGHWTLARRGQHYDPALGVVGIGTSHESVCRNGHVQTPTTSTLVEERPLDRKCLECNRLAVRRRRAAKRAMDTSIRMR